MYFSLFGFSCSLFLLFEVILLDALKDLLQAIDLSRATALANALQAQVACTNDKSQIDHLCRAIVKPCIVKYNSETFLVFQSVRVLCNVLQLLNSSLRRFAFTE